MTTVTGQVVELHQGVPEGRYAYKAVIEAHFYSEPGNSNSDHPTRITLEGYLAQGLEYGDSVTLSLEDSTTA